MGRNIEIKARLRDPAGTRAKAETLADGPGELIRQHDTFFQVPRGRLKLRRFDAAAGELIYYERPDQEGPKESHYTLHPTPDPDGLTAILTQSLGEAGVVVKERTLFLAGRTRIHLDRVEGLGEFLELEVVLAEGENVKAGEVEAARLMQALGVTAEDLINRAYIDLLTGDGDLRTSKPGSDR